MKTNDIFNTHPLLSDRVRLAIMAALASEGSPVPFTDLAERLELTRGNLSAHIRKLEAEGLVLLETFTSCKALPAAKYA